MTFRMNLGKLEPSTGECGLALETWIIDGGVGQPASLWVAASNSDGRFTEAANGVTPTRFPFHAWKNRFQWWLKEACDPE